MIPQKELFTSKEQEQARKAIVEIEKIIRKFEIKGGVKVDFTFSKFEQIFSNSSNHSNENVQLLKQTEQQNATPTSARSGSCPPICYEDRVNNCYHCIVPNC